MLYHPKDIIDAEAANWHSLWAPRELDQEAVHRTFQQVRDAAEGEFLPAISVSDIRGALRLMKPRAGLGIDMLSPGRL